MTTRKSFQVSTLPVKNVTVYADRAEVKRLLKTKLEAGRNEIVVEKLTRSIEKDSIRVEGRGAATIAEVQYQEKHVKKEDQIREEQKELTQKLDAMKKDRQKVQQDEQRLKKQRTVLDQVAEKIGGGGCVKPGDSTAATPLFGINDLSGLDKFFEYFAERSSKLDAQLTKVEEQSRKLDEEIQVLEGNLDESKYGGPNEKYLSRDISILLDTEKAGDIELDVSYIVWNASWTPSYDLRVYTAERQLKLFYYGLVQQQTGESWNEVTLALSTATPSVGGQIPELGTLRVGFYKPPPPPPPMQPMMMKCGFGAASAQYAESEAMPVRKMMALSEAEGAPIMAVVQLDVQESVISTSFEIARPTTIPSDNASHKVTVAVIDLKPDFEYETVPSKSPLAFLKARVKNTSQYPLLAGPTSVFLDNNFVAKGKLKAVSPLEEFTCSLGVDHAIRVEYKPARKFHEETGLLSKSSVTTHEQKINIKNTRKDAIKILVVDHLPLTSDEKLRVHLMEPQIQNTKNVRVNKQNNVEWELQLNAGEQKELMFKYQVEHPKGERVEYKEDDV